jgi:ubiquinone/menaquinone biosynthesis C-methylase UbiE
MAARPAEPEQDQGEERRGAAVTAGAPPSYVCPACRSALTHRTAPDECYECSVCSRRYPVIIGIPDFRLRPDPWIDIEADREKGTLLEADTLDADFETTVRAYWARTPGTPPAQAERFTRYVVDAEPRAREWLLREHAPSRNGWWLDVGCGTADLVLAARRLGHPVVGIDVAFRWLVVARRRLQRANLEAPLVCCNAEHLPFDARAFARADSLGTLEHCLDPDAVLAELARVLEPGGTLHLRTVNRFTLLPEPHVGVWGVGYVPRRWADAYVRWRSGQRYEHHRLLSPRELRRALAAAGFQRVHLGAAALLGADRARAGALAAAAPVYELCRRAPGVGRLLAWGAPLLEARAHAPEPPRAA